jgi:hypothetical protein
VGWYTQFYVEQSHLLYELFLTLRNPVVRTHLEHMCPLWTRFKHRSLSY